MLQCSKHKQSSFPFWSFEFLSLDIVSDFACLRRSGYAQAGAWDFGFLTPPHGGEKLQIEPLMNPSSKNNIE
jgi:hypothetical protein